MNAFIRATLLLIFLVFGGSAQSTSLKVLTTAVNGTSVASASKNAFFLCPKNATLPDGSIFFFPTNLTKANSSWVVDNSIIISKIPTVNGSVTMDHVFDVTTTETTRRLKGNGVPNHPIGTFPIPNNTIAYEIYSPLPAEGYPNAAEIPVAPYDLDITVPKNPVVNDKPTCINFLLGVATQTGVAWHIEYAIDNSYNAADPNAALPTDLCWGHPYQTQYHYHGYSWKCFPDQGKTGEHSPLAGYALDGFGVYGPKSEGGVLVSNADLDECHGHVHEIEWDGEKKNMFHYHLNSEYPYSIGCFRGTPVAIDPNVTGQVSVGRGLSTTTEATAPAPSQVPVSRALAMSSLLPFSIACIVVGASLLW